MWHDYHVHAVRGQKYTNSCALLAAPKDFSRLDLCKKLKVQDLLGLLRSESLTTLSGRVLTFIFTPKPCNVY